MLYRTGLLKKEWRYAYYENPASLRTALALGVFQGMLAFAAFFLLQTLKQSVLSDSAPYLLQTSYFSTAFIYLWVSYATMFAFFLVKLGDISYAEVYDNRWYSMVHLGFPVFAMVLAKLLAQLLYALFVYAVGFAVMLVLTTFLKAPFVPDYLVSQFVLGAIHITTLLALALAASLAARELYNARQLFGLAALALPLVQWMSGFLAILSDREAMRSLPGVLLPAGGSWYMAALTALLALSVTFCILRATRVARLFNAPVVRHAPAIDGRWGEGVRIVVKTDSKNHHIRRAARLLERAYVPAKRSSALSVVSTAVMAVAVLFLLLVNGLILTFNYASPIKETSVMGFIPYIFQSSTMEPAIRYNDIAFFEEIDQYVQVDVGDIILYKDVMGEVQVRRINEIRPDEETGETIYELDIDNYPVDSIADALKTSAVEGAAYGRLVGVNRGLGAVVLFANTVVGRMLFLLAPTVLIFYSGQIRRFFDRLGRGSR